MSRDGYTRFWTSCSLGYVYPLLLKKLTFSLVLRSLAYIMPVETTESSLVFFTAIGTSAALVRPMFSSTLSLVFISSPALAVSSLSVFASYAFEEFSFSWS